MRPRLPSSSLALTTGSMRASRAGATDPQPTRARSACSYPGVYRAWLFASANAAFASVPDMLPRRRSAARVPIPWYRGEYAQTIRAPDGADYLGGAKSFVVDTASEGGLHAKIRCSGAR